jgi:predicted dienelactone hydrolase
MRAVLALQMGEPRTDPDAVLREFVTIRPADVSAGIDAVLRGVAGLEDVVDPERIGMAGHSFGGWTTLAVTARDRRIRAALPLAPAGGSSQLPLDPLRNSIDFGWGRDVPTLFVVAARDTLLPLAGMHELFARTSSAKRMVVIENADHMHFCDRIDEIHELFRLTAQDPVFRDIQQAMPPITELCPAEHGYVTVRGLGLAHMDAHLRGDERAAHFLTGDLRATLAARGVTVAVY